MNILVENMIWSMIARPQIKTKNFFVTQKLIELSREIFHIVDFDTKTGLL